MKRLEIIFKNILLKILLLSNKNNKSAILPDSFKDKKVLFIRLNRIGDALVCTPLLKLLYDELNIDIHVLADKKNCFIFQNQSYIKKCFIFNKGIKGFSEYKNLISNEEYDAIVDLHDDVSTTVSYLLALSKGNNIFGLKKRNENLYTSTIVRKDSTKTHVVERILEIAKLFKVNPDYNQLNIVYESNSTDFDFVNEFLSKSIVEKKPLIGINISAGNSARFWGINRFRELLEFLKNYDVNIVLITTVKEVGIAYQICRTDYPVFYTPKYSTLSAFVSKLDFLFTPDTSTVHLASMYEIPVFGLYVKYNTNDIIWYAYKSEHAETITKESNLDSLDFSIVKNDFKPFFEKILYGK